MSSPLRDFSARKSRGERVGGEAITRAGSGAAVVSEGTWFQNQAFGQERFEGLPVHPPNCQFIRPTVLSSAQQAHSSAKVPVRPEMVPFVQILHFVLDDKPFVRKRCAQGHKV